jgi:hypothetical protein
MKVFKNGKRAICPYKKGKYGPIGVGSKYCNKCWMNAGYDSIRKEIVCREETGIDLQKLEAELDAALANETEESLTEFLNEMYRKDGNS